MTTKLTLLLGTVLAGGAITVTILASGGSSSPTTTKPVAASPAKLDRTHMPPAQMRTLVVYEGAMPTPSDGGRTMHALLRSGAVPSHTVVGTVMTDTDCGPDRTGMSRCRNVVRMPGAHMMVVRHPHRMSDVPCMTPGEKVLVTRAA